MKMNVNNVLTNKGGAGKSLVAILLTEYFLDRSYNVLAIDMDPNQATLAAYEGLAVSRHIVHEQGHINLRLFDGVLEEICGLTDNGAGVPTSKYDHVVLDSGAGGYGGFMHKLEREGIVKDFADHGIEHTLHVVIAGGQGLVPCLRSLDELATKFGEHSSIVVWLNPYFDALPWSDLDGFMQSKIARQHGHLFRGVIEMPALKRDTELPDFAKWLTTNRTFTEAMEAGDLPYFTSRRLKAIRDLYHSQLDGIFGEIAQTMHEVNQ